MKTATQTIEAAFIKSAVYQTTDDISPEDYTAALGFLNGFLNGINGRGAVFPTVALTLASNVPIYDHQEADLEWALAKAMAPTFGKMLQGQALIEATQGETRFIAQYTTVYGATPDAGLTNMPSQYRRRGSTQSLF
jgi:hypothetical protein